MAVTPEPTMAPAPMPRATPMNTTPMKLVN
jgi:hypothetical protein